MQLWIIFSILAAATWALVNVSDKYVLSKLVRKPVVPLMFLGIIGLLGGILVYFVRGFSAMSWPNILLAGIAGVFYVAFCFCYFKAVQLEEISRMVPLMYVNALFVLVISFFFLGEKFALLKYAGIMLLIAGAILISVRDFRGGLKKFKLSRASLIMIFGVVFLAANAVITKYLLGFSDFWTVFSYTRIGTFIALIPIFAVEFRALSLVTKQRDKRAFWLMTLNESLNLVAVLFITIAMFYGTATLVNALSSVQPFFVLAITVLLSRFYPHIIKEEIQASTIIFKLVAIAMIIAGAVMII